jgi:dinuclear metal center YbgI/SA1388 family protein
MQLAHLIAVLDSIAPLTHAEAWDNVGLLLGRGDDEVRRALITIDLTPAVLQEAQAADVQLIVAYHPPWFASKKRLCGPDLLLDAARQGFAIYSPHTALDAAFGGTNDVLADAAGICQSERKPLVPASQVLPKACGMGRVGINLGSPHFATWLKQLKSQMGVQHALVARPLGCDGTIRKVAVCAGAGDGLLDAALHEKADVYVTGELRHHDVLRALRHQMTVVALLHTNSERAALAPYQAQCALSAPCVTFVTSVSDADPYTFA